MLFARQVQSLLEAPVHHLDLVPDAYSLGPHKSKLTLDRLVCAARGRALQVRECFGPYCVCGPEACRAYLL